VLVCLSVCGCDDVTPTPAPTVQGPSLEQMMADYGVYDVPASAGDIAGSRATLDAAAVAVEARDLTAFLGTLSYDYQLELTAADLSGADTSGFAAVLRNAKLSKSGQNAIVYETNVNGLAYQIFLVPEDGVWKIDAM
jgi:hypothetical protein